MDRVTVLLIGSGGREHALAWKLVQSGKVGRLVAAPGNPGMAGLGELRSLDAENVDAVVDLANELGPELVVIGPEAPIAAGVSDALRNAGFSVFAPSLAASRLEWDKSFAKDFMERYQVPTAGSRTFGGDDLEEGRAYLRSHALPVVLKASGLAAGKGVVIAGTHDEAVAVLEDMLSGAAFGDAGSQVVVEEFMQGEEASIFAVTDGTDYVLLAPSQDHKRAGDGDTGPNTGGMGAYAPAPVVTEDVLEHVKRDIIEPTLRGMRQDGNPYVGCLYVGLMVEQGNTRVVEFNCRFGDPETQVVLPLYQGDLYELFQAASTGKLAGYSAADSVGSAVCVVLASGGYPGAYEKGKAIRGADSFDGENDLLLFHAGTREHDGELVTSGGRVLGVTAVSDGDDFSETIRHAYEGVERIAFDAMYYRHDIGARAVDRVEG